MDIKNPPKTSSWKPVDLLPCPFCGNEQLDTSNNSIRCNKCGATNGVQATFTIAVGKWNTRIEPKNDK